MPEPETSSATPNASRRRLLASLALGAVAILFFASLGAQPLSEPDEGRYAEIPREMLASGDFVLPRLDGVLYFEKPPLYYWLNAAAIRMLGLNAFSCRLWSALFGCGGLALACLWGRRLGGARAAWLAPAILGTSPLYFILSRLNTIDMTVSFFLAASLTCFWMGVESAERPPRRAWWWRGMFAAAALAVLSKGLIGIVIPGGVIFLYLLLARRWSLLRGVPWLSGIAIFLLVAAPWHVLAGQRHDRFLWFYFVHEHVLRYATPEAKREEPFWYFLGVLAVGLLPWTGLLAGRPRDAPAAGASAGGDRPLLFLGIWAGFVAVFFSLSRSKLAPYVLPACLPLAVLAALAATAALERGAPKRLRWALAATATVACLVAVAMFWVALGRVPRIAGTEHLPGSLVLASGATAVAALLAAAAALRDRLHAWYRLSCAAAAGLLVALLIAGLSLYGPRSAKGLADYLRPRLPPGLRVVTYRVYPQALPAYLGRTVDVVDFHGELSFGMELLSAEARSRRFPEPREFAAQWASSEPIVLVTEEKAVPQVRANGIPLGEPQHREGKFHVFLNPPAASLFTP